VDLGRRGAGRRILVVEDNPMNFEILREVLLALGDFEIDWARHGGEVPVRVAAGRPDLVFLDINLPGEDGFAVARTLRGLLGPLCPPLFGLSANAYDDARQRAAALGFAGYIAKPFRIDQIRAALDHLPGRAGRRA
jgi:CheY-like chemotaxis protein